MKSAFKKRGDKGAKKGWQYRHLNARRISEQRPPYTYPLQHHKLMGNHTKWKISQKTSHLHGARREKIYVIANNHRSSLLTAISQRRPGLHSDNWRGQNNCYHSWDLPA